MAIRNIFGKAALEDTQGSVANFVGAIANALRYLSYDAGMRLRVITDTSSGLGTVSTVTTVTTVTTVATVTNQAQMAGISTIYDQYAQMFMCAQANRSQIIVS